MARKSHRLLVPFVAGLAAGAVAVAVSIILKDTSGGLFLPEIASQALFSVTPGEFESQAVENFGPLAKYSAFIGSIIANIIASGIMGIFLYKVFARVKRTGYFLEALLSSALSYIIFIIIAIILVTLIQSRSGIQVVPLSLIALSLIPSQLAFGFVFSSFFHGRAKDKSRKILEPKPASDKTIDAMDIKNSRRAFLRLMVASAVALPIIYLGVDRLLSRQNETQELASTTTPNQLQQVGPPPKGFEDPNLAPLLASEVTPTYLFYRIDINPIVPQVDSKSWSLTIKGLVEKPLTINYDQIKSMPSVEEYVTLECISNKIGGDLISTALWKGVSLSYLLDKAAIKPNVKYVVFRCADGYDVGIPIERSQMEGTILAYDMNYTPLTPKHGFPVRAIVPGLYGMMNPKWLTEIELVDKVYEGYWQRLGWANNAEHKTGSSILIPGQAPARQRFRGLDETEATPSGGKVPMAGIAFGGDRGISKVEVSTDGGTTWKTAKIKDPLSQYTWVLWTAGYLPPNIENYSIVVRATDKSGNTQTIEMSPPFPNGATGYHTITV
ncbi:MAG TPA: molybdopterin-dependent oxidoreductase [Nitrososphaeraceae archaeon]|nr:molybdopterin-dependent oxidoreductase [Nitrososphaeraceae archaeon]